MNEFKDDSSVGQINVFHIDNGILTPEQCDGIRNEEFQLDHNFPFKPCEESPKISVCGWAKMPSRMRLMLEKLRCIIKRRKLSKYHSVFINLSESLLKRKMIKPNKWYHIGYTYRGEQ